MIVKTALLVLVFTFSLFYIPSEMAQGMLYTKDVYVDSDRPSPAPWKVEPVLDKPVSYYCDKTKQSVFDVGKTTVRCIASDTQGNEYRASFVVTVGYTIVQIPEWFEKPTRFWLDGIVSDQEYVASIESLSKQGIIQIPTAKFDGDNLQNIPIWVKQNAQKWVEQKITDDEFSIGLQWLLRNY